MAAKECVQCHSSTKGLEVACVPCLDEMADLVPDDDTPTPLDLVSHDLRMLWLPHYRRIDAQRQS